METATQTAERLKVGQELWANPEGPNSSRMGEREPIKVEVATIGKKYFTVLDADNSWRFNRSRFYLENLKEDSGNYSAEWQLYTSLQAIEDKKEANKIARALALKFQYGVRGLSLDQLRRVQAIVEE